MNRGKICEKSLSFILYLRQTQYKHGMQREKIITKLGLDYTDTQTIFPSLQIDGSLNWSILQAKYIEEYGLEKWLQTKHAEGYGAYYETALKEFLIEKS